MKEDYLWDKIGEDAEIERLENALRVFRYRETAPPALPAKTLPFKAKTSRRMFRFALAFAACAAMVIVCLGVWLQFSSSKIEVANNSAETELPKIAKEILVDNSVKKQSDMIIEKVERVEIPKQSAERKIVRIQKVVPSIVRRNLLIARKAEVKKPSVILSKEEKYAYGQLMLALSITSSELKLVRNKIDGVEKKDTALENER